MKKTINFLVILAIGQCLFINISYAKIYKCNNNGKTVYSGKPCVGTQQSLKFQVKQTGPREIHKFSAKDKIAKKVPQSQSTDTQKQVIEWNADTEYLAIGDFGFFKFSRDYSNEKIMIQLVKSDKQTPLKPRSPPKIALIPYQGDIINIQAKPLSKNDATFSATHSSFAKIERKEVYVGFSNVPGTPENSTTSYRLLFKN